MWSQLAPNLFLDQQREPICSKQQFTFSQKEWIHGKKPADKSHQPQLPLVLRTSFRVLHVTPGPSACFPGTTPSPCGYELAPTKKHSSSLKTSFLRTGPKRPQRHEHPPLSVWALGCFLLFFFFFNLYYYCVHVTACVVHRWRSVTFLLPFCGSWGLNSGCTGLCDEGEPFC